MARKTLKNERLPKLQSPLVLFCLVGVIFLIYSNSFTASWHFDDHSNIVQNRLLHVDQLTFKSLAQTLYSRSHNPDADNKKMFRPLACLTLGLNWYVGQNSVLGYHIINVLIHILAACLLYLTVLSLLDTPFLKEKYSRSEKFWIAFLSAVFVGGQSHTDAGRDLYCAAYDIHGGAFLPAWRISVFKGAYEY